MLVVLSDFHASLVEAQLRALHGSHGAGVQALYAVPAVEQLSTGRIMHSLRAPGWRLAARSGPIVRELR